MSQPSRIVMSNFPTGFETDRTPFNIDNSAFPVINNMYIWRGRMPKKRGTSLLGRLSRTLTTASIGNIGNGIASTYTFNIFTLLAGSLTGNIVLGSATITLAAPASATFTDNGDGTLSGTGGGAATGSTINYATGSVTLVFTGAIAASAATITLSYTPNLPVMGLEDFETPTINFPTLVAFDTVYAYEFNQATNMFFDVSFYKNTHSPVTWSGADYQQFGSANYAGVLWVTNQTTGLNTDNPGLQFKAITGVVVVDPTHATLTITAHGLIVNDFIWVNEIGGNTGINRFTGQVTVVVDPNHVTVQFPDANIAGVYTSGGIAQYLTATASPTVDVARWFDGIGAGQGWVNFMPPLSDPTVAAPEYLVSATVIIPFRDRLLFVGAYTQTSTGVVKYYQDRVIYSQNGTPFYAGSLLPFTSGQTITPALQTFDVAAWYQNISGRGGFIAAGIQQQIVTVSNNEDVLLIGFEARQTKLIYTSNDVLPFIFQTINSELGSESTFSAITLDVGAISIGDYGIALTTQNDAQRIDLKIPDQVFEINNLNFGTNRVNAIRDYKNEWIYFCYPNVQNKWNFPTQTLLYNYRDVTWALLGETFTHHGNFRRNSFVPWSSLGHVYGTWAQWTVPWNSGSTQGRFPDVIGGNQQGFVMLKDQGIADAASYLIDNITVSGTTNIINSPNHCMDNGDFILITGAIGTPTLNNTVRKVIAIILGGNPDPNNFAIDGPVDSGGYGGGGVFARLSIPFFQTKQFPLFWNIGRKARIGLQRYLFDTTEAGQVTMNLYLNQDADNPSNLPPSLPNANDPNSSVIFNNIVLTSPEPNNPTAAAQDQIWHRMSTSLIGDTFQVGLTLSEAQIRDPDTLAILPPIRSEIVLHAMVFDTYPGGMLG